MYNIDWMKCSKQTVFIFCGFTALVLLLEMAQTGIKPEIIRNILQQNATKKPTYIYQDESDPVLSEEVAVVQEVYLIKDGDQVVQSNELQEAYDGFQEDDGLQEDQIHRSGLQHGDQEDTSKSDLQEDGGQGMPHNDPHEGQGVQHDANSEDEAQGVPHDDNREDEGQRVQHDDNREGEGQGVQHDNNREDEGQGVQHDNNREDEGQRVQHDDNREDEGQGVQYDDLHEYENLEVQNISEEGNAMQNNKEKGQTVQNGTAGDTGSCKYCIPVEQYSAIVEPKGICQGRQLDLLFLVTSSHREDAAERRIMIRNTWSKLNNSSYKVHHVFVLGMLCFFSNCLLVNVIQTDKEQVSNLCVAGW